MRALEVHLHADYALPDRSYRILALVVRTYIETGEPVSSLKLTSAGGLGLSSATVRHVLATLEEQGYVHQPHASSGRVPTDLGYRCYVDSLMQGRRSVRLARVRTRLLHGTVDDVLSNASQELSRVCHHVGFALAPTGDGEHLHRIDFVPLGAQRVLVVVVNKGGQVAHKVIEFSETAGTSELQQAANYLNTEFSGLPLGEVRAAVLERLEEERTLYDALLSRALRLASSSLEDLAPQHTIFIQGASSLLDDVAEEHAGGRVSLATLRALFGMIEEKHRLVRLLNEYIDGPGLMVVIGQEHTTPDLRHFSLVASTYSDGRGTGTVGIIGPTRMRYSKAIMAVDGMAQTLSRTLVRHGSHH